MKVSINIKVRNAEWFHSDGSLGDYLEEWQVINDGKVSKFSHAIDFEYTQPVISHKRYSGSYELKLYSLDESKNPVDETFMLDDVTVIEFLLKNSRSEVVVSNELIHSVLSANNKDGRLYWYIFLKENCNYFKLLDNIWITLNQFNGLKDRFKEFVIDQDQNLVIRSLQGLIPVKE